MSCGRCTRLGVDSPCSRSGLPKVAVQAVDAKVPNIEEPQKVSYVQNEPREGQVMLVFAREGIDRASAPIPTGDVFLSLAQSREMLT